MAQAGPRVMTAQAAWVYNSDDEQISWL